MLVKSHLYIPESKFTETMRRELTMVNPAFEKAVKMNVPTKDLEPMFQLYGKVKNNSGGYVVQVPRYYGDFIHNIPMKYDMSRAEGDVKWIPSKEFKFNDSQVSTIAHTFSTLFHKWGAVLVAKTGEGKTIMAINIICSMRAKTLILVHKNLLVEQWRKQLLDHTDLKEDDIGLLQQGKYKGGRIVIGMMQSLMKDTIDWSINRDFGMVVVDEVHRIGARQFLRSFVRFNPTYRLGLSATPKREDRLEKLYYYHISDNLVQHVPVRNWNANYKIVEYDRSESPHKWKSYPAYIHYKVGIVHNLIDDKMRSKLIADLIYDCWKGGRKVLVLSERIAHLKELMVLTQEVDLSIQTVRFFGASTITKKQRQWGMKQERVIEPTVKELAEADVIFSTYSKAKEGVDIPSLDTLIYATPISSEVTVIQSKGRIEREYEDKQHPLVIDIKDIGIKLCVGMFFKRLKIYRSFDMQEL